MALAASNYKSAPTTQTDFSLQLIRATEYHADADEVLVARSAIKKEISDDNANQPCFLIDQQRDTMVKLPRHY